MSGAAAPPPSDLALELSGVAAGYDGRTVVEGVHLRVAPGEFCGVVGPNGGGKSTLLKVVLGLLSPSAGTVRVLGRTPSRARHEVGYLPQTPDHDPAFPVTVRDVVGMGLLSPSPRDWLPGGRRERRRAVDDALGEAGLEDVAGSRLGQLSGGQRERVLLLRALVSRPALLVLDEPTTGLDPQAASMLHAQLVGLRDAGEVAALVVSHDLEEVEDLCPRTVRVDGGLEERGAREGSPAGAGVARA
ncbi:ABC transporter ATP-binding protein [Pseudokineococcus sp. 5B2Z-1]|uniref:metal ABC transporter ATP-binding protein n=1 Tax=Pseudokineococcus sp. 5B2Z-1 TaxID=3132744 RepID=UPI00309DC2CA